MKENGNPWSNPPRFQMAVSEILMHTMKQKGLPAIMKCTADKNSLAETSLKTVSTGLSNSKHLGSWISEVRKRTLLQLKEKAEVQLTKRYYPY